MSDEDVAALVVDNGSGMCKVSFVRSSAWSRPLALVAVGIYL